MFGTPALPEHTEPVGGVEDPAVEVAEPGDVFDELRVGRPRLGGEHFCGCAAKVVGASQNRLVIRRKKLEIHHGFAPGDHEISSSSSVVQGTAGQTPRSSSSVAVRMAQGEQSGCPQ